MIFETDTTKALAKLSVNSARGAPQGARPGSVLAICT